MNRNADQDKALRTAQHALLIASTAQAAAAALTGGVDAVAGAVAPVAVPYVAISAPPITTVNKNARLLVTGFVTIDKNGGTLAAGDEVTLQPFVNGAELGSFQCDTGAVAAGGTVKAYVPFSFFADTSVAAGTAVTVAMKTTTAGGHTSGVLVNNGFISVVEMPKTA